MDSRKWQDNRSKTKEGTEYDNDYPIKEELFSRRKAKLINCLRILPNAHSIPDNNFVTWRDANGDTNGHLALGILPVNPHPIAAGDFPVGPAEREAGAIAVPGPEQGKVGQFLPVDGDFLVASLGRSATGD
ncbi:hypothetical protein MKZ38_002833 [Zalerion maritima]|uniref:Uncharacterized protein n=1 Tax=Zalerion maritima TaxID=339359 RepID=A0AAD5RZ46_9PEZI|nr:hypothetical protein MKZ38_002833 [Zalerion maritima]